MTEGARPVPEPSPSSGDRQEKPLGRLVGRVLLAVFVAGSLVMWSYGLWGPREDPPGTLDEPGFSEAAEDVCADTLAAITALPPAHEASSPEERAAMIAEANTSLGELLEGLRALAPDDGDDAGRVSRWLDDWETFLSDRRAYSATLASGEDARFVESEKEGDHISEALAFFAEINDMPSCAPPDDV